MTLPNEVGQYVYQLLRKEWFSEAQAAFITAQAAHETANFTSSVFTHSNNCFGFKFIDHVLEVGQYKGYGSYATIEDCIKRYTDYYKKKKYPGTFISVEDFVHTLKENNYFEAPEAEYLTGVKFFMNVYFPSEHISGAGATW